MTPARHWRLRRGVAADGAAMAALHRRAFAEPWDADTLAAFVVAPGGYAVIADAAAAAATPAGFILCRVAGDEAEILTLAVCPDHRRGGCGRALVEAAVAEAAAFGAPRMLLEVAEDNAAARRLYRACGFVAFGRRRRYYRPVDAAAVDALLLARGG